MSFEHIYSEKQTCNLLYSQLRGQAYLKLSTISGAWKLVSMQGTAHNWLTVPASVRGTVESNKWDSLNRQLARPTWTHRFDSLLCLTSLSVNWPFRVRKLAKTNEHCLSSNRSSIKKSLTTSPHARRVNKPETLVICLYDTKIQQLINWCHRSYTHKTFERCLTLIRLIQLRSKYKAQWCLYSNVAAVHDNTSFEERCLKLSGMNISTFSRLGHTG